MAMLKTDHETHGRFMRYKAKRYYEGDNLTVTMLLNEFLDKAGAPRYEEVK